MSVGNPNRLARLRELAHMAFDVMWKSASAPAEARAECYKWLANQLGISDELCHFRMMDEDQCELAIQLCTAKVNSVMEQQQNYPAEAMWTAAAAAYRINGNDFFQLNDRRIRENRSKNLPNARLMEKALQDPGLITEEDRNFGQTLRDHYRGMIFSFMGDQLHTFLQSAHRASTQDELPNNMATFNLLSVLPKNYMQEQTRKAEREALEQLKATSQPIGEIWQRITIKLKVVDVIYKRRWRSLAVNGLTDDGNVVFFFDHGEYKKGDHITVAGVIKGYFNNATQLTQVRVI